MRVLSSGDSLSSSVLCIRGPLSRDAVVCVNCVAMSEKTKAQKQKWELWELPFFWGFGSSPSFNSELSIPV